MTVIVNERCARDLVRTIDAALELRVAAHRERKAGRLTVPEYKAALKAARQVEDALEPLRGTSRSRAWERCGGDALLAEREAQAQLVLELA